MKYFEYMKKLLEPLGVYDFEGGVGASELEAVGEKLDLIFTQLENLGDEVTPVTAQDYGLLNYEQLLPYSPAFITLQDRRRAIISLLKIRKGYFTVEALCDTLSGCGLDAVVEESDIPMTVEVSFPSNFGIPYNIDELMYRIEQILPCHLDVIYKYNYSRWEVIMDGISSWDDLQKQCASWEVLEIYRL